MREVDPLFQELRDGMLHHVTGPEPAKVIARARARTVRRRFTAGALAAAVAVSVVAFQGGPGRDAPPPVLTTSSPAPVQETPLKLKDLLYAEQAAKGSRIRWYTSTDKDGGSLFIQTCGGGTEEESDPLGVEIPGTDRRFHIKYEGNLEPGNEMTTTSRGEEVIVFTDEATARRTMNDITTWAGQCEKKSIVLGRPRIGDEAVSTVWTEPDSPEPQRTNGVAARQGRVIVVYGDLRNNGRPLATLADHEHDARTMVDKLKSLGY
ncbi:hypothetical protein [Actinocorallia populi]|uniref:hypothetical protein n=1 Tax=Actinocorallia populi TaxID=2079200 RepID=UPI000D08E4D3|nr:hypothetical protein [Actinocorallia populi]